MVVRLDINASSSPVPALIIHHRASKMWQAPAGADRALSATAIDFMSEVEQRIERRSSIVW
jgi:hypothetical protein